MIRSVSAEVLNGRPDKREQGEDREYVKQQTDQVSEKSHVGENTAEQQSCESADHKAFHEAAAAEKSSFGSRIRCRS